MKLKANALTLTLLLFPFSTALAEESALNSGDTSWLIVSTALVMMMTPAGLALFYGGMSRYKNLLNTFAMTFIAFCLASVIWVVWGYSLAFGTDNAGIIGGLDYLFMSGIGVNDLSGALIIGAGAGIIGYFGVTVLKKKLGYDDSLDAFGVHGLCGVWGRWPRVCSLIQGLPKEPLDFFMEILRNFGYKSSPLSLQHSLQPSAPYAS